jgi:uncharacterized iron-regulated membrane protein
MPGRLVMTSSSTLGRTGGEHSSATDKSLPNKLRGKGMRPIHRILGTILLAFTLYFGVTGSILQTIDLRTIASHAAATDPDMMAIRESIDGEPNFIVIEPTDYAAAALPQGYDFNTAVANVLKSARLSVGAGTPLKFLELRIIDGRPVGLVQAGDQASGHMIRFDPATGAPLPNPVHPRPRPVPSLRGKAKAWHRLNALGDQMVWLNALVGIGLFVMIVTGLILYFQLLRTRKRAGLNAIFWSSGGWWRSLHRWVSITAALFLMIVSITGTLLSIDTLALWIYRVAHAPAARPGGRLPFPAGMVGDVSSPLPDAELPAMLTTTLSAYRSTQGATPIKVLRLRYFSGMPQGVIVTGGGDTRQLVFNAVTGTRASMTEPGYPYTGFPFGWEEHEFVKQIHRGDALGIPGRLMDLFAGLSLIFISASGLIMYMDLLRRRRRGGRKQLFWT